MLKVRATNVDDDFRLITRRRFPFVAAALVAWGAVNVTSTLVMLAHL